MRLKLRELRLTASNASQNRVKCVAIASQIVSIASRIASIAFPPHAYLELWPHAYIARPLTSYDKTLTPDLMHIQRVLSAAWRHIPRIGLAETSTQPRKGEQQKIATKTYLSFIVNSLLYLHNICHFFFFFFFANQNMPAVKTANNATSLKVVLVFSRMYIFWNR